MNMIPKKQPREAMPAALASGSSAAAGHAGKRVVPALVCASLLALTAKGGVTDPPQFVGLPDAGRALATRAFQGIPSMAVSPGGRLWATWYAGKTPSEDQNNYAVLATSGDDGLTWEEALIADPDGSGSVRAFDPELWVGPDGVLRWFWAQAVGHDATVGGVWCLEITTPESAQPAWRGPSRLTDGVMMCKPTVLSTGEWALPASTWRETDFSAGMVVSTNQGVTWSRRGAANVPSGARSYDEHMIVERRDASLWMLVRTTYGIGESVSTDRGATWTEVADSGIRHASSRSFITRLASGRLLHVRHSPPGGTARSHLAAFVSEDDGKTWFGGLMLDERSGISYPDGQQSADGLIRVIYDYNRTSDRQILMAAFREEDAIAGRDVSGAVRPRQTVSSVLPAPVNANSDGQPLRQSDWGAWSADGAEAARLALGERIFTDRDYTVRELPAALADALPTARRARFLRLPMSGARTVTCSRAGTVYVLTPAPERDAAASQSAALAAQGFAKVRLPEVRLLGLTASPGFCTVYQKTCSQGERVTLGAWSVPLYFQ